MYLHGLGCVKDPVEAFRYFLQAANKDDPRGQYYLGLILPFLLPPSSFFLFQQGGLPGSFHLNLFSLLSSEILVSLPIHKTEGVMYEETRDYDKALTNYSLAAAQGEADAQWQTWSDTP